MNGPANGSEPMYLRPLYELTDDRFDHLMVSDPATWQRARRLARHAALAEPLSGLEVNDFEHGVLEWLAGQEASTVAVIAALLWRTRQSAVIPVSVGTPPFDGAHPVRLALAIDAVAMLQRYGYRRATGRRSLAGFLRALNALVVAYETGKR
jgi:hypothetical protein